MLKLELYKLYKRKLVLIVLILIGILVFYSSFMYIKRNYINGNNRYKELQENIELFEKHKGVLTDERLKEFCKQYKPLSFNADYIEYFFEDRDIKNGKQIPVSEIYKDIDFDINFGYAGETYFLGIDLSNIAKYVIVFIIIAFSPIFTYEKEHGVYEVMLSSRNGRKECTKVKVLLSFLITNIFYLLLISVPIIVYFFLTGGRGLDTSIQLPHVSSHMVVNINYGQYILHIIFISLVVINFILLIILSVSFLSDNPVVVMCIGFAVSFILRPDVAMDMNNNVINIITAMLPFNAVYVENLCKQIPFLIGGIKVQWLYVAEIIYSVLLIFGAVFFFKKLTKNQKYYAN